MVLYILLILNIIFPFLARAEHSILWQSERLQSPYLNVMAGNYTAKEQKQIALLSAKSIEIYSIHESRLNKNLEYPLPRGFEPLRLNKIQMDACDALIVSGLSFGRAKSFIYDLSSSSKKLIQELPYFVSVVDDQKSKRMIAQKSLGNEVFSGPIFLADRKNINFELGAQWLEQNSFMPKGFRLYQLTSFSDQSNRSYLAHVDTTGFLSVYEKNNLSNKLGGIGESMGGAVFHIDQEVRNSLGELTSGYIDVPVRFVVNQGTIASDFRGQGSTSVNCDLRDPKAWYPPCLPQLDQQPIVAATDSPVRLYAAQNQDYLKNVVGARPAVKNAVLMVYVWQGSSFQKEWASSQIEGGIADFDLVQWDEDSQSEVLLLNTLRGNGYWETQKGFHSQLLVIKKK